MNLYYHSSYELRSFVILETLNTVKSYNKCRFSLDYTNPSDNSVHQYIPDVKIYYTDGFWQIIEIKAEWQLDDEINKAKFKAAKEKFGNNFEVWTEKDLDECQT